MFGRSGYRCSLCHYRKCPNRLIDVLDLLRAKISELKRQNFSDLIIRDAGQTDATSTGESLQPGRNVYTITKKVTPPLS